MLKVIYGNEPYLISKQIQEFAEKADSLSYHVFDEFSENVWQLASTYPAFSDSNYIVVKCEDLEDAGLFSYVDHLQPKTEMLVIPSSVDKRKAGYKKLKKGGFIEEVNKESKQELYQTLTEFMSEYDMAMSRSDMDYLIQRSGYLEDDTITLYSLKNSIGQICMSGTVSKEVIDMFVTESGTNKIFALSSCLMRREAKKVFYLANKFLGDKENPLGMLSLLERNFRLAYKASLYPELSQADISKKLGVPMFQFADALVYSSDVVTAAMKQIQQGIRNIKQGKGDGNVIFIVTLSQILTCLQSAT